MSKKTFCIVAVISFLCLSQIALAAIEPPEGVPKSFPLLLENIASAVGKLIASLGAIMLIVAGILYLTSAGSPERIGTAKKALIYAIAGMVIGLGASAIVGMVKSLGS